MQLVLQPAFEAMEAKLERDALPLVQKLLLRGKEVAEPSTLSRLRTAARALPASPSPFALQWAKQHAGEMVAGMQARMAVREIMVRAVQKGMSPETAAKLIRQVIGLDQPRAEAVENLRFRLQDAAGKKLQVGSKVIQVPKKLSESFIAAQQKGYAERLLRDRAVAIAKFETQTIVNAGQRLAWEAAMKSSGAPTHERMWMAKPGACDTCKALNGKRASLFGSYPGGVSGPPIHSHCRCGEKLVPVEAGL